MRRTPQVVMFTVYAVLVAVGAACSDSPVTSPSDETPAFASQSAPAPSLLVPVPIGGQTVTLWPYTGVDFSGGAQDPVNLLFTGQADPRALRAALFALSGDRTAFGLPNAYPFNCVWSDAIGDLQTAYTENAGWAGSAIQLQCGGYGPLRFHLRLFGAGPVTVGAVHFELLIPGTADHQVISWELAEQLVTADFVRSGLLGAPPSQTLALNASPFREIPAVLYNGIPAALRAAIQGPLGDVTGPVPIGTDGRATVLALAGTVAPSAGVATQAFTIQYDQVVPKPFCATDPVSLVRVVGPIDLRKTVRVTGSGDLHSEFHATGRLAVTPMDPATGAPAGPSYAAEIQDYQTTRLTDAGSAVHGQQLRLEVPPQGPSRGRLTVRLDVAEGHTRFRRSADCAP